MKNRFGLTKIMFYLSSVFLVVFVIGVIVFPSITYKMKNTQNYCFSEKSELQVFMQKLNEENIPFSQLSDTTVNVLKTYGNQVDSIYQGVDVTNNLDN